ncbi:peptidoglycan-binding domain-containing protein [Propionibacteriaceae bacterium Y2011]|uniref:peptidoglycan-binding domain-containing protein n=1 Tax=Microlunatus sp. Y2014 TaxID=3418488 RepID=UPI003B498335
MTSRRTLLTGALGIAAVGTVGLPALEANAFTIDPNTCARVQRALAGMWWGLEYTRSDLDAEYGPRTAMATRVFQAYHGLTIDGKPGPLTQAKLFDRAKVVQQVAGVSKRDGNYNQATLAAVTAWQQSKGLTADGIAGPGTMSKAGIDRQFSGSSVGGNITRAEVIARAGFWVLLDPAYSRTGPWFSDPHGKTYRRDCSGYVSMCLHASKAHSTHTMHEISYEIDKSALRPGDILNQSAYHVTLFDGWTSSARTHYDGFDTRGDYGLEAREIPYDYPGDFLHPRRYHNIV